MSHFVIGVLTDNGSQEEVDALLRPFHEFECTGWDDKYVQDVDISKMYREDYEKYSKPEQSFFDFLIGEGIPAIAEGDSIDYLICKYHYFIYKPVNEGEEIPILKVVERTNPNSFWDWYVIGGRWDNSIIEGNKCKVSDLMTEGKPLSNGMFCFGYVTPEKEYVSKGRMGWFGIALDEKENWLKEEMELLTKYPDKILVIVDCHI